MTEDLGVGQRLRQVGAIEGYQRSTGSSTFGMQGARQQLLAGAGFTQDQDRGIRDRRYAGGADHRGKPRRVSEKLVESTHCIE